jgi:hypothetical protein
VNVVPTVGARLGAARAPRDGWFWRLAGMRVSRFGVLPVAGEIRLSGFGRLV